MLARHDEPPPRRRLNRADRRELILKEAKRFFAQHGFDANTRDLARVLGVTQPGVPR
jgi:AcrR family transcriptional regulator